MSFIADLAARNCAWIMLALSDKSFVQLVIQRCPATQQFTCPLSDPRDYADDRAG